MAKLFVPDSRRLEKATPRFRSLIQHIQQDLADFDHQFQPDRIAVTISVYDADNLILQTLIELVEQFKACSLVGEIFVVLNSGGGNTACLQRAFTTPDYRHTLQYQLNVDAIHLGKILLHEPDNIHSPNPLILETPLTKTCEGISLFIISQEEASKNRGKIRAIRDISQALYSAYESNGYHPEFLLAMDAETRIRTFSVDKQSLYQNQGLSRLISLCRSGVHAVGARIYLTPFEQGKPLIRQRPPAKQWIATCIHGSLFSRTLVGGCILGHFPTMICGYRLTSQVYPGAIGEDIILTVILKTLRIPNCVDRKTVHLNRCCMQQDRTQADAQILRWQKGFEGVKQESGSRAIRFIYPSMHQTILAYVLYAFLDINLEMMQYFFSPWLWTELLSGIEIFREARQAPYEMINGNADWTSVK